MFDSATLLFGGLLCSGMKQSGQYVVLNRLYWLACVEENDQETKISLPAADGLRTVGQAERVGKGLGLY